MKHIQPPHSFDDTGEYPVIFLAGSIDMGSAIDWQAEIVARMHGQDVTILNPRRDDWDSSWEQTIEHQQFREQVEWELRGLERADKILMYFAPGTKAPITLLELGLFARSHPEKLIVCCPDGFWRKGNIDIVCNMYGIKQVACLDDLISEF